MANLIKPFSLDRDISNSPAQISPIGSFRDRGDVLSSANRSYGHNYLKDQCVIMVTFGFNDAKNYNYIAPFQASKSAPPMSRSVSIVVTAANAAGEPAIVDLPIRNTLEPILFYTHVGAVKSWFWTQCGSLRTFI